MDEVVQRVNSMPNDIFPFSSLTHLFVAFWGSSSRIAGTLLFWYTGQRNTHTASSFAEERLQYGRPQ
jgi:hypothetical protein